MVVVVKWLELSLAVPIGSRVQILKNISRTLFAKFPSEHGNCKIRTWEFG
jgi:hypothetical protein